MTKPLPDSSERFSEEVHRVWVEIKGDKTLRLDYDLSKYSIVLDLGGFEGQWASDIFAKYLCQVHVFEPVKDYCEAISKRFARNENIHVYPFGLGATRRKESISLAGDASSFVRPRVGAIEPSRSELMDIVAADEFLNEYCPGTIDLIKINIEGAEYELLEHLISCGIINRMINIQIQFHDFVPNAADRMHEIKRSLAFTHRLTYEFPFVWENWKLVSRS